MSRLALAALALAALALLPTAGCYRPPAAPCGVACSTTGACPGELTCTAGVCVNPSGACGETADGGATADARPDGGGLPGTFRTFAAGSQHVCAITAENSLWCWGNNDLLQLGTSGDRTGTPRRVDVGGAATNDWDVIAAGLGHTCGIRSDGSLWCWGANASGQCGAIAGDQILPTEVVALGLSGTRWTAVTVGAFFSCGLREDRSLWCWGGDIEGQLGQGTSGGASATPLHVGVVDDWRTVDAGLYHVCAIAGTVPGPGVLSCWGYDPGDGRLGDGGGTSRHAPSPVMNADMVDWVSVAAGDFGTCGLAVDGALYCWGEQYHAPGFVASLVPLRYGADTGIDAVDTSGFGGCLLKDGAVSCWGYNESGELARPSGTGSAAPVPVALVDVQRVDAGEHMGCALAAGGVLSCWGANGDGQLGNGAIADARTPVEVLGGHQPWRQVDVGEEHTCAVTMTSSETWCWGRNSDGQLGGGAAVSEVLRAAPVQVGAGLGVSWDRVGAGAAHACALDQGDVLYCWGANDRSERGAPGGDAYDPVQVPGESYTALAVGLHSSCAVSTSQQRVCWGANDYAQIGNGMLAGPDLVTPTWVNLGPSSWSALGMGAYFGCGVGLGMTAGELYCWGQNEYGQAAQGTLGMPVTAPALVADPTPGITDFWLAVAAGAVHGCGVLGTGGTGALYCWGHNGEGQLGVTSVTDSGTPQLVPGAADWIDVAAGDAHTCAVRATGALHCFGRNDSGQLGDGTSAAHTGLGAAIGGVNDWWAVSAGGDRTCGIRGADRRLYCWGDNRWGALGSGESARWQPGTVALP